MKCSHCYGTGEEPDSYDINAKDPITKCHKCKGTGVKPKTQKNGLCDKHD